MTPASKPHSEQLRGRIIAGLRYECDAISFAIGEGCGECLGCVAYAATNRLFEQLEAERQTYRVQHERKREWRETAQRIAAERDALQEQFDAARRWYGDHVTEDGIYDAQTWGDPFVVTTSNPAMGPEASPPPEGGGEHRTRRSTPSASFQETRDSDA